MRDASRESLQKNFVTKNDVSFAKVCKIEQKNWVQLLKITWFCVNAIMCLSIDRSSFEIVCGRQLVLRHLVDTPYAKKGPQARNFTNKWKSDITRTGLEEASKRLKR